MIARKKEKCPPTPRERVMGEGDFFFHLEERVVGKLNKCSR
jgi:hypothetical protein